MGVSGQGRDWGQTLSSALEGEGEGGRGEGEEGGTIQS